MFRENINNAENSNEKIEDGLEKEVEEKIEKLLLFLEEMCDGFDDVSRMSGADDLYNKMDKILTKGRVNRLLIGVEEISSLALKCNRLEIFNMLRMLSISLAVVNSIYEQEPTKRFSVDFKNNNLSMIKQSMQVLVGAKKYFNKSN